MINIKIIPNKLTMPKKKASGTEKKPDLKKEVNSLIRTIESDKDASKEWERLKALYEELNDGKCHYPRKEELLKLMTPTIRKFAQLDPKNGVDLSTKYLGEK